MPPYLWLHIFPFTFNKPLVTNTLLIPCSLSPPCICSHFCLHCLFLPLTLLGQLLFCSWNHTWGVVVSGNISEHPTSLLCKLPSLSYSLTSSVYFPNYSWLYMFLFLFLTRQWTSWSKGLFSLCSEKPTYLYPFVDWMSILSITHLKGKLIQVTGKNTVWQMTLMPLYLI